MGFLDRFKNNSNRKENPSTKLQQETSSGINSSIISMDQNLISNVLENKFEIGYKSLTVWLLNNGTEKEIKALIDYFKKRDSHVYNEFLQQFGSTREGLERNAIKTKIERDFFENFQTASLSLNVGYQIAFLLGFYIKWKERERDYLTPIYTYLLKRIEALISQKRLELKTIIESENSVPVRYGLTLFFIYRKEKAIRLFKKSLYDDKYKRRRNENSPLHYHLLMDAIFERINLEYIPKIEPSKERSGILLITEPEESISKKEVLRVIDNEDNFNVNVPLSQLPSDQFINPHKDIEDFGELIKLMNKLFDNGIQNVRSRNYVETLEFSPGEVFLNNICSNFGEHEEMEFIRTREILRELLENHRDFKLFFFRLLHELKEMDFLLKWNSKFPKLLNFYLGDIRGFSESSIKNFFRNDKNNLALTADIDIANFIRRNSHISYRL